MYTYTYLYINMMCVRHLKADVGWSDRDSVLGGWKGLGHTRLRWLIYRLDAPYRGKPQR